MNLNFSLIANLEPEVTPPSMDDSMVEDRLFLSSAPSCYQQLEQEYKRATCAYRLLQEKPIDNALYEYFCSTFAIDDVIGLPKGVINAANQRAYTAVCMEGFASYISDIVNRIVAFFMRLYEAIRNILGLRTFRHRNIEASLNRILSKVSAMSHIEFDSILQRDIKVDATTFTMKVFDTLILDCENMYRLMLDTKDVDNIQTLTTATSGALLKLGYKVQDEYKIVFDKEPNYPGFVENTIVTPGSSFQIRSTSDVTERIRRLLLTLKTILDVEKWYPMNLKKYAERASKAEVPDNSDQTQKNLEKLSEEQKCQAYLCKFIVIYMNIVDSLCARSIATFGVFEHS